MRYHKVLFVSILSLIIVGLGLVPAQSVKAQVGYGGVLIDSTLDGQRRYYYTWTLSEGQSQEDVVTIGNTSKETKTIMVYGGNWVIKADGTGLEYPKQPDSAPINVGDWMSFDKNQYTIPAGGKVVVKFKVTAPANADVGDHQGEIYAQEIVPAGKTKGSSMQIYSRVGISAYVTVPGEINRDLQIKRIRHSITKRDKRELNFHISFENHGNVKLTPKIDIRMRGLFGKVGEQLGVTYGSIARDQKVTLSGGWVRPAPWFGRFVADFTFTLPERDQINKDLTHTLLPEIKIQKRYVFWVLPFTELLYLIIALFIAYLLRSIWLYYLIVNRLKTKTKIYVVVAGDTLTKISAKLGVDPRVLAKFNLLRWPYEVKPGEKLLVPTGRLESHEWRERLGQVLGHRAILGKAFGHFFGKRNTHEISKRMQGIISTDKNIEAETVVVDRGDTIEDVANFAGASIETLVRLNNLRPPYRLRAGQELLIPKKHSTKPVIKKKSR